MSAPDHTYQLVLFNKQRRIFVCVCMCHGIVDTSRYVYACILYDVHCTSYTLYDVHCTVYVVYNIRLIHCMSYIPYVVYTVRRTVYVVYTVQCTYSVRRIQVLI